MAGSAANYKKSINDGFFEIRYEPQGVFLIVHPPVANGSKVDVREVLDKISAKNIKNFMRDAVEAAVNRADKTPVKIAEAQEEKKLDAVASVMVTPDKMKAYMVLTPPDGGRMLSADEMVELLKNQGVVNGINKSMIDNIAQYPVYNEMICVAEGSQPVNGQNGSVEFYFDVKKEKKPAILDDGRVDFRELGVVESVKKGQVLCTLVPPMPGIKGKTVTGADVPALEGKPAVLPKGKNVLASEDGQSLVAAIDGQVNYIDGKVSVFATYEVPADVDNSTGNIYFIGNVCIRGNVLSGFVVEAGGSVEVWGVVEGATIKAGGDIILRRGMQGMGKGVLESNGDIIAKYIENSNVQAKNDIKAEAIMHSYVKCGNKLELGGRKGLLVGGACKVGKEITAKVIGSVMATVTDVEVGVNPALKERYRQIKEEMAGIEADIKKTEQAIALLRKLEAAGALPHEKIELLEKSIRTKEYLTSKLSDFKDELAGIEVKLQQDSYGKVRVYNYIYPGVKVAIGSCMTYIKENLQYCTLYRDGADIRVGPIDK